MSELTPVIIEAGGSNTEIGRAHALATPHLRADVQRWVTSTQEDFPGDDPVTTERVEEVVRAWQDLTPATLEQIGGMAQVYDLPARGLLTAVLATYLRSLDRSATDTDGCTTLALPGPRPLLMKNRDNNSWFLPMQTVLRVQPDQGHPWLALSTAGAPGVHSSGMNAAGLCITDTHVASRDIGPGVPRFSSMMHVLEQCASTEEAVEYLLRVPQMGLGNLTMVDAGGRTAVVECGFSSSAVLRDVGLQDAGAAEAAGTVVATNHFVSDHLATSVLEPEEGTPGIDSRARRAGVIDALRHRGGDWPPSRSEVRAMAAHHVWADGAEDPGVGRAGAAAAVGAGAADGGAVGAEPGAGSLCKHGQDSRSETVSTVVFDPVGRTVDLCLGRPCAAPFFRIGFDGDPSPVQAGGDA